MIPSLVDSIKYGGFRRAGAFDCKRACAWLAGDQGAALDWEFRRNDIINQAWWMAARAEELLTGLARPPQPSRARPLALGPAP